MCYRHFLITEFEVRRVMSPAHLGDAPWRVHGVLPSGHSLVRLKEHFSAQTCASDRRERGQGQDGQPENAMSQVAVIHPCEDGCSLQDYKIFVDRADPHSARNGDP